jgi:hypothetical protein
MMAIVDVSVFLSYAGLSRQATKVTGWTKTFENEFMTALGNLFVEVASFNRQNQFTSGIVLGATQADWNKNGRSHDIVVYILDTRSSSLNAKNQNPPPNDAQGFTFNYDNPRGVIVEVFAEGNALPHQFANMIFHEIMHAKLDVGQTIIPYRASDPDESRGIHNFALGGGGLANMKRVDGETLTPKHKKLMNDHLLDDVPMRTSYMR